MLFQRFFYYNIRGETNTQSAGNFWRSFNVYASIPINATESLEYHLHFDSGMNHVPLKEEQENADKLGLKAKGSPENRHVSWSFLFWNSSMP